MPEKPNISQVGPCVVWSSGHVGPCDHIPAVFQSKGKGMGRILLGGGIFL